MIRSQLWSFFLGDNNDFNKSFWYNITNKDVISVDFVFILENKMFNELVNYNFDEVGKLFSYGKVFFRPEQYDEIRSKVAIINEQYFSELNKIEEYEKGEFRQLIQLYDEVSFDEEPAYMVGVLELKSKQQIIKLIEQYFDEETFKLNKSQIPSTVKEEVKEANYGQLDVYLSRLGKTKLYGFISIVGFWQRRKGYFLNKSDVFKICSRYSNEGYYVNRDLGLEEKFYYIFGKWGRIGNKFIDIDFISLKTLILPYLRNNINELIEIAKIIIDGFKVKSYKNDGEEDPKWRNIQLEVAKFIQTCEEKGLIKEAI